jgi:hypothetical protein
MTVQEAATALGITVEAVRGRMHRGKYGREKTDDGRVFVVLSSDQLPNGHGRSEPAESNVQSNTHERLNNQSAHVCERLTEREDLVEELRDHVAFLRAELEARNQEMRRREEEHREEARRKDTIIAQLTQRIPELPPASTPEAQDGREAAAEASGKDNAPSGLQEPVQRRSWLYRFFFGP